MLDESVRRKVNIVELRMTKNYNQQNDRMSMNLSFEISSLSLIVKFMCFRAFKK